MLATCPVCGVETSEGGLCPSCYSRENPPFSVKTPLKTFVCPHCGSYRRGNRWIQAGGDDPLAEIALDVVKHAIRLDRSWAARGCQLGLSILGKSGDVPPLNVGVRVEAKGRPPGGGEINSETCLEVRIERCVCPPCSRRKGGSYTTMLQIRAENRGLTRDEVETVKRVVARMGGSGGLDHVVSLEEEHGGVNIKTSSSRVARRIAERIRSVFGGKLSGTAKLVTRDRQTGKKVYRGTILLRIPEYCVDDTVLYCGKCWVVKRITGEKVVLSGLDDGRIVALPWARADGVRLVKRSGEYHPAVVTLRTPSGLQVYDMVTCETLDVEHGSWLDVKPGERIRVVRLGGKTSVVPS